MGQKRGRENTRGRERNRRTEAWLIILVLALLLGAGPGNESAEAASLIKKGSEVPRFELSLTGGGKLKLQEELGKASLLLLYWSLYCDACREDLPRIQKMTERLGPSRVKVLAINGDGKSAEKLIQGYWQNGRFTFVSLLDEETKEAFVVERLLGVEKTPAAVLVDRKGIVQFAQEGKLDLRGLEESIQKTP
jgi:peroxiredoxin